LDPAGEFSLVGLLSVNLNLFINPQATAQEQLAFFAKHFFDLKEKLEQDLRKQNQYDVFKNMETPLMSVLLSMELNGIKVDKVWLKTLDILLSKEMQQAQAQVDKIAGRQININSPKQLGILLFEEMKLPYLRKTKTGYSTDEEVLSALLKVHPIAQYILNYRESAKLKSTYVEALLNLSSQSTHRVYTNFNQTGTLTGRLSSFSPNLQNIPIRTEKGRLIRQAFIAGEGKTLLSLDYSQIDLRVLAHESGDETLINAFKNTQDIHLQTASEIFNKKPELITKEERSAAKAINFGIVYGQGPMALAESLDISVSKAKEYIDSYFTRYDTLKEWINKTAAKARQEGYVKTFMGHIRYMPEFEADSARLTSFANRASVNTIIQGGSSDIIKKAMLDIYANLPKDVKILLQIHDELVFEVPTENLKQVAAFVKDKMENAVKLKVPLIAKAKAGKNLNEMGAVL
jgi:DNA polymerase-1